MHSSRKETIVGGLAFLALVVAVLISYIETDDPLSDGSYEISAVFSRIDGLSDDAEIRMGGVVIGHVVKTNLNENYRAVVTMLIDQGIPLPLDTSAAIHTDGLFGGKFIELEPGGEEEFFVNGSEVDMTQGSVVVEELLELIIAEGKSRQAKKEN